MEIFCGDNERFQEMFHVYTGHSAGQPVLRYMAVTDQFIYLLTKTNVSSQNVDDSFINTTNISFSFNESNIDALTRSTTTNNFNVKYIVYNTIALFEIDYISIGIDAQVFCIHLKKNKHKILKKQKNDNCQSHQDRRLFAIDSGSKQLTKVIIKTLKQCFLSYNKQSIFFNVFTHSTQLSMVIKKLLQKEIPSVVFFFNY